MKLIFRSVQEELDRLINEAREKGKIIERAELSGEEFNALLTEYDTLNHPTTTKTARETGKVLYMGVWVVNTEHVANGGKWSLYMSIDTDDDAALEFEGRRYCMYLPKFNKQFEGDLDYLAKQVNKMSVPEGGKYENQLRAHLASLRVAITRGQPFYVMENGNQDIEITLDKTG